MNAGTVGHGHFDIIGVVQHCGVSVGGDDAAYARRLRGVAEVGRYETAQRARFVRDLVDFVDDCVEAAYIGLPFSGGSTWTKSNGLRLTPAANQKRNEPVDVG